tara:strand:- start:5216 stop:5545 length:330 start_codon:yes stop_codon:yes gene_type:complete
MNTINEIKDSEGKTTHKMVTSGVEGVGVIRVITKRAFMKRIDQADRISIRKSTDDFVIDIHEDLKSASSVDLDDLDTIAGVDYLIAQNLLTNTNLEALFNNGTESTKGL